MVFIFCFVSVNERFGLAEQAISAIYLLASQPDILCGNIIKKKTRDVFHKDSQNSLDAGSNANGDHTGDSLTSSPALSSVRNLSQLLFIVGHIASMTEIGES